MDYSEIKSLMESGHGPSLVRHLERSIEILREQPVDPNLPADQFKVNALARQEAITTLRHILTPFLQYHATEVKRNLVKDSLYYSHSPRLPQ